MLVNGTWLYWPEQCKFCKKSWTTEHCERNQAFMNKLQSMNRDYLGTVEFKCDYFVPDEDKIQDKVNNEACCTQ